MMTTFVLVFAGLLLIVTIMAVGVIFSNKPIKGSCGGLSALGLKEGCEICGGDAQKCETVQKQGKATRSLGYDAMQEPARRDH